MKSIQKRGLNNEAVLPRTEFTYYGEDVNWSQYNWDYWNGYTRYGSEDSHLNSQNESEANEDASTWNLKQILSPLGSTITVEYESDRITSIGTTDDLDFSINHELMIRVFNLHENINDCNS